RLVVALDVQRQRHRGRLLPVGGGARRVGAHVRRRLPRLLLAGLAVLALLLVAEAPGVAQGDGAGHVGLDALEHRAGQRALLDQALADLGVADVDVQGDVQGAEQDDADAHRQHDFHQREAAASTHAHLPPGLAPVLAAPVLGVAAGLAAPVLPAPVFPCPALAPPVLVFVLLLALTLAALPCWLLPATGDWSWVLPVWVGS